MPAELFGNGGETTLSAAVDNVVTTLPVTSAAGFPSGEGQYRIRVGDELMVVTGGLGTTSWTVTRGAEGTTAAAHASGATVRHILTADALLSTPVYGARVHKATAQAISHDVFTIVNFDAEGFDTASLHDNATNPSRVLLGKLGRWLIISTLQYSSDTRGRRQANIFFNGTHIAVSQVNAYTGTGSTGVTVTTVLTSTATTDYVDVRGYQDSTVSLNIEAGSATSWLAAIYLGS